MEVLSVESPGLVLSESPQLSFSKELYGLDWNRHFPYTIPNSELQIHYSNYQECFPFLKKYYQECFPKENTRFIGNELHPHKMKYYQLAGDFFEFKIQNKVVGVFIGTGIDWSSYYLRFCIILPEHRGRQYLYSFFKYFISNLSIYEIDRIESEIAPNNKQTTKILSDLGFIVAGINISERWGVLTKYLLHLKQSNNEVFKNQFCGSV